MEDSNKRPPAIIIFLSSFFLDERTDLIPIGLGKKIYAFVVSKGEYLIAHLILPSGILIIFKSIKLSIRRKYLLPFRKQNISEKNIQIFSLHPTDSLKPIKVRDFQYEARVFLFRMDKEGKIAYRNWKLIALG